MPHLINACSYKMMSFLNKLGKVQHIGSPGKVLRHLLKKTKTIIYQFVGSVNFVSWPSSDIKNNYFLGKGSKTDLITMVPPSPKWGGCQSFDWCLVLVVKLFVNSFCPRSAMYGLIFWADTIWRNRFIFFPPYPLQSNLQLRHFDSTTKFRLQDSIDCQVVLELGWTLPWISLGFVFGSWQLVLGCWWLMCWTHHNYWHSVVNLLLAMEDMYIPILSHYFPLHLFLQHQH